jgi:hypothetical protein
VREEGYLIVGARWLEPFDICHAVVTDSCTDSEIDSAYTLRLHEVAERLV